MNKNIGFIGCGNMGSAMISGIVKAEIVPSDRIYVCDHHENNFDKVKEYNVNTTTNVIEMVQKVDILILSVKPYVYESVISQIKEDIKKDVIVVCIAAGKSIEQVEKEEILKIFSGFGKVEVVKEELMDAVTAVSGSSPAYVYMMIEAMADAAVKQGMPRKQAYVFASQAVYGASKMVLETHQHPGQLKDAVCSPSGTTIEAVGKLEETGFRSSIIQAMDACYEKSKRMK